MADTKIVPVTLYPIEWRGSSTRSSNTVTETTKTGEGTAMFYGSEHNKAGWLAVFKNTNKQKLTVKEVWAFIGSYPGSSVTASVVCKPLGRAYTNKLPYITTEKKYLTAITPETAKLASSITDESSKCLPMSSNSILTTERIATWTVVTLEKPIEVNPGDYFCAGVVSHNIEEGHYINIVRDNTEQNIRKIFYTQAPNDGPNEFTWYRSGNQDDNTNWKKYQVYIAAKGECSAAEFTDIVYPNPARPAVTVRLNCSESITLNQNSSTNAYVRVNTLPISYTNTSSWTYTSTNTTDFSFEKTSEDALKITSTTYDKDNKSAIVTIIATEAITGVSTTTTINVTAVAPSIKSISATKSLLRPTESLKLSCSTSGNCGTIKYTVNNKSLATIEGNTLILNKLDNKETTPNLTVTATAENGGASKTLTVPTKHWTSDDIQLSFDSTTLQNSTAYTLKRNTTKCKNISTNNLGVTLNADESNITLNKTTLSNNSDCTITTNNESTVGFTITARLTADPYTSKKYNLNAVVVAESAPKLLYPKTLQSKSSITMPAIARYSTTTKKWQVHFAMFPIYIKINANKKPILVTLKEGAKDLIIGQAFNNNIIDGVHIIRPEPIIEEYDKFTTKTISKTYTLKIKDADTGEPFTKTFTINYQVYTEAAEKAEDIDLISSADKDKTFNSTFGKVKNTLQIIQSLLYEYDYVSSPSIGADSKSTLNNSNYITAVKELAETQLRTMKRFITNVNSNSASFITTKNNNHRTSIATGQYIMADDSGCTKADWFKDSTASPFRELVIALKNLTDTVTHWPIYTTAEGNVLGPITQIDGNSIAGLYL